MEASLKEVPRAGVAPSRPGQVLSTEDRGGIQIQNVLNSHLRLASRILRKELHTCHEVRFIY